MNTYNVYKKRDGQSFKQVSTIYADTFDEAQKKFAKNMTEDNHNKSNDIQWLDSERDGVDETGWYDFNGGYPIYNDEVEKYDADEAAYFLMVSEADIKAGFSSWSEDVYTWEIRDKFEVEVWQDGELYESVMVESLKQADEIYPSCDGYEIKIVQLTRF